MNAREATRERVAMALTRWMNGTRLNSLPDWGALPVAIRAAYLDQADAAIFAIEQTAAPDTLGRDG